MPTAKTEIAVEWVVIAAAVALVFWMGFTAGFLWSNNHHGHTPRLVGWDCVGASEDNAIYADFEDDFPRCDTIEENR